MLHHAQVAGSEAKEGGALPTQVGEDYFPPFPFGNNFSGLRFHDFEVNKVISYM
jgi:hypothetical protein